MFYFHVYAPSRGKKAASELMKWRYTHFIGEKFNFAAFFFPILYFLFKGYFLGFLSLGFLLFVIEPVSQLTSAPIFILYLSIMLTAGFYAYWLAGISLKARGYELRDVILAHNKAEAQYIYAQKHLLEVAQYMQNQNQATN